MKPTTIELMKHNIRAYNKHGYYGDIDKLTPLQLLHHVHPSDRKDFALALKKDGLVTEVQIEEYLT